MTSRFLVAFILLFSQCISGYTQSISYDDFLKKEIISSNRNNSKETLEKGYVVMISIDGFRHDYAEKYGANNILDMLKDGVSTKMLIPSFPSKTFPNHYTIVTGLYPGNHGLIANSFYSREKKAWYSISDKESVKDGSWYGGTPIWSLAERQNLLTANLFWVGSEAVINGFKSTYSFNYDGSVPNQYRVRRVIDWLKMPELIRPHLILTYFSIVDDAGHRYGPNDERTGKAVLEVDDLIGDLRENLDLLDLPITLILVSDHGMSVINQSIGLTELVDIDDAMVDYGIPTMIYQSDEEKKFKLLHSLLKIQAFETYLPASIPSYLNFNNTDRIGDIILYAEAPVVIKKSNTSVKGGTHGFNPYANSDMGGILYMVGPQLLSGVMLPALENVHIYPFLAELLGLKIEHEIDGDLKYLKESIK